MYYYFYYRNRASPSLSYISLPSPRAGVRSLPKAEEMGKYMKKSKPADEEMPHQSALGVRTRARTLALQRLPPPPPPAASYLQLRSRRLEKPLALQPLEPPCKDTPSSTPSPSPYPSSRSAHSRSGSVSIRSCCSKRPEPAVSPEVSFGENVLDVEERGRKTRETTPCSLIRDSDTIATPGSTNRPRPTYANTRRILNSAPRNIPSSQEMEDFFSEAEQHQQRIFVEKYNFDPVNDRPLPGRFEWVKLDD